MAALILLMLLLNNVNAIAALILLVLLLYNVNAIAV